MPSLDSELNAANRRFTFTGGGLVDGTFSVVEMTGFEALSKPFNFELILVSKKVDVDFDAMLSISNPATLTICTPDGTPDGKNKTTYHGVLSEFEQLQEVDTLVFYKAVLVPRLQRLSLYRTSDVFLDVKQIPDVLETVIKASGLDSSDYVPIVQMTTGSYRPRTFVCQYQETNFDFISRWMEKEGMYYYFDHSGAKDKLVIVDDVIKLPADISNVIYRPVEDATSSNASDSIHGFVCRQQPLPKKVMLQGFNYAAATVLLEHSYDYDVSPTGTGEVMLYGENFLTPEEGSRYAKLRAEQILCNGKVFKGEATATGIRSGHFIQMSGHYREDFNVKYLVTEIEHSGSQAGVLLAGIAHSFGGKSGETSYRHSFRAIPRFRQLNMQSVDMQFRPECKTKRPYVAGTISAIIDAEGSGQYADLDEFGQYKVQLPFCKFDKTANKVSARIRMATPYAGSNHGMHFPLHKGAEVLLSFMDGDPDQPVILGAVPNSEHRNVVNDRNPYQNTINTAGGNLLHMGDKPSNQQIWLHSPMLNTTIGMGNVASRNPDANSDADTTEAAQPSKFKKAISYLAPPVSYRVSTAGSSETLSGGSNTGLSNGRSYVNLQGDSVITLLGSDRMTYKGIFDWTPQGETSYREDRVAIDWLDNFVLANNIIRHAEDTLVISAGRRSDEQVEVKKNQSRAQKIAYTQLALNAALAVKSVVLVNMGKKDPLQTPGDLKTYTSPLFTALNFAASKLIGFYTGNNQEKDTSSFHTNMVVNCNGLNLSTKDDTRSEWAKIHITRDGISVDNPDPAWKLKAIMNSEAARDTLGWTTVAGFYAAKAGDFVKTQARNFLINKPNPPPMEREATKLEIVNEVKNKVSAL